MIPARILRQLEQIDWDFPEHLPGTTKSIHWYPGTFPSDIPATLVQALSSRGDLIFDPYGGVGTTSLESIRQGRKAWVVETNAVGCLAAYVAGILLLLKSVKSYIPLMLIDAVRNTVLRIDGRSSPSLLETDSAGVAEFDSILNKLVKPTPEKFGELFHINPNLEKLSVWIEERTLHDLKKISEAIDTNTIGAPGRLLGLAMISAVLRSASSQNKSWGHIADNVKPREFVRKDIMSLCLRWLSRVETIITNTDVTKIELPVRDDIRLWLSPHNWLSPKKPSMMPRLKSKLLITSPPYADAIDYTLAQRLSLYALGLGDEDILELCRTEIGARRKRFDSASHEMWATQLAESLTKQLNHMDDVSLAVFLLPHKDAGRERGTEALMECMESNNWKQIIQIDRSIRQVRARQSWTSIKKESLYIFGHGTM